MGQCVFARDGHLVSALQLHASLGRPLDLQYGVGAHATVVGRAGSHVPTAAGKVCVDVGGTVLEVGRGSDGATHLLFPCILLDGSSAGRGMVFFSGRAMRLFLCYFCVVSGNVLGPLAKTEGM